jgi:hypothetical protein
MHKNAMKCNKKQNKWCINKHGASKIIDMFETYHSAVERDSKTMGAPDSFSETPVMHTIHDPKNDHESI